MTKTTDVAATDIDHEVTIQSSSYTGSRQSLQMARNWLHNCLKNHSHCPTKSTWFPNRVVDVGTFERPCLQLRVKTFQKSADIQPYATLSHCWGQLSIKQLLSTNLNALQKGIISDELPKTFCDAILLSRTLGIRYLWIDSLCIMQDSHDDWITESAEMERIYRHATCNIAASAAIDGSVGCFMERDPRFAEVFRVHPPPLPKGNSPSNVYDIVPQIFWGRDITYAPLGKRAWVLQEHFLSPRVIHCGASQLLWECCELVRNTFCINLFVMSLKSVVDVACMQSRLDIYAALV